MKNFTDTWILKARARLVAIGASSGGPAALVTVLKEIPDDFPAGVVIIQHLDERFSSSLADQLNRACALPVRIAKEDDRPEPGCVLIAGTNDHLAFKSRERVGYKVEPRLYPYRPSIDVFFESACASWNGDIIGVLLTGMGRDGAKGLQALRNKGHYTIAQDEATSAVYGMPKAAANLGAAVDVLPLDRIGQRLVEKLMPYTLQEPPQPGRRHPS